MLSRLRTVIYSLRLNHTLCNTLRNNVPIVKYSIHVPTTFTLPNVDTTPPPIAPTAETEDIPQTEIPNDEHSKKPQIMDINIEDMMYDDPELGNIPPNQGHNPQTEPVSTNVKDIHGACVAPIDINPWIDEEEELHGTVFMQDVKRVEELPPIPKQRETVFKLTGIEIRLPRRDISMGTYRYRLDQEDQGLADDMRICKFS